MASNFKLWRVHIAMVLACLATWKNQAKIDRSETCMCSRKVPIVFLSTPALKPSFRSQKPRHTLIARNRTSLSARLHLKSSFRTLHYANCAILLQQGFPTRKPPPFAYYACAQSTLVMKLQLKFIAVRTLLLNVWTYVICIGGFHYFRNVF